MDGIKHIKHKDIDMDAWDACISRSCRPLVYGSYRYLNAICEQWDALVYGNYEAAFPLPVKRRWGVPLVYQPFFCQQLGLFAPKDFHLGYNAFLKAIPRRFLRVRIQLNPSFMLPSGSSQRTNLLLDLNRSYDSIAAGYNADARKNLRKCVDAGIRVESCRDFDDAVLLYKSIWGALNPVLKENHYTAFLHACKALEKEEKAICFRACHGENVLAYAIFLISPNYLHYVCAAPTVEGRKVGVMHTLIDHVVKTFAGNKLYLDFEGSEIPEVAAFYRKFGAVEEQYGVFSRG